MTKQVSLAFTLGKYRNGKITLKPLSPKEVNEDQLKMKMKRDKVRKEQKEKERKEKMMKKQRLSIQKGHKASKRGRVSKEKKCEKERVE
ncbi:hypothetical protein CR513_27256, partial [Mucuna pruriens]